MSFLTTRYSEQILRRTFPEHPGSLAAARHRLEQVRGRTIRVQSTDPGHLRLPTGLWLQLAEHDVVWVNATLPTPQRFVSICHEFAHMLYDHRPTRFDGASAADGVHRTTAASVTGVDIDQVTAVLGRCGGQVPSHEVLARQREHEAETLGRMLARPLLHDHQREIAAVLAGR